MKQFQSSYIFNLLESAEHVELMLVQHAANVAARLDAEFATPVVGLTEDGEDLENPPGSRPDFLATLQAFRVKLGSSTRALHGAENRQIGLERQAIILRRRRKQLAARLAEDFGRVGRVIEDLYRNAGTANGIGVAFGTDSFIVAAVQGRAVARPGQLVHQVDLALEFLRAPGLEFPPSGIQGQHIEPADLVATLEPTAAALRQVITDLKLVLAAMVSSRKEKNDAMATHESMFSLIARGTEVFFNLAGEHELAARLRPSSRRSNGRGGEAPADEQGPPDDDGAGGDPLSVAGSAAANPVGSPSGSLTSGE